MRFSVTPIPYAATPGFGPEHVLGRLAAGELPQFPILAKDMDQLPLLRPDRAYVVAGQQPCLLGGPLFSMLKAATSIGLARKLASALGKAVRPLFWIASEDHDVLEVNRVTISGRLLACPYRGSLRRGEVPPVSSISLVEDREKILAFVRLALPEAEFKERAVKLLESCRYDNYGTLFADLLAALFEPWDLEIVEPSSLREATSPVLARIVEEWPEAEAAFERGRDRIRSLGFDPPLRSMTFFEVARGVRVPVAVSGDAVTLSTGTVSRREAADAIRRNPAGFSPGAALRPVLQDAAIPVLATVAGPTEILYLWQARELYKVAGVTPSLLAPRISATFVEQRIEKKLGRAGLPLDQLFKVGEELASWAEAAAASEDPASDAVSRAARALLAALASARQPSNERWLDRSVRSLEAIVRKTVRRLRAEAHGARDARGDLLRAVEAAVLPGGELQERVINVFDLWARYGPAWIRALCEDTDPWGLYHSVVTYTV